MTEVLRLCTVGIHLASVLDAAACPPVWNTSGGGVWSVYVVNSLAVKWAGIMPTPGATDNPIPGRDHGLGLGHPPGEKGQRTGVGSTTASRTWSKITTG